MDHDDRARDKRQFPRFPFKQAVKFQTGEYFSPGGSLSRDLSRGGVCLAVNEFVPVKSVVTLHLQLNQESKMIRIKGAVMWVRVLPESERYEIGIQFEPLTDPLQSEVNQILISLM